MKSPWMDYLENKPLIGGDIDFSREYDVVVVGAGMAGVLTATMLKNRGADVLVVEAGGVGQGASGNTTAKITSQHGLTYWRLLNTIGFEKTQAYYRINEKAVRYFKNMAGEDCDLEIKGAFVYTVDDKKSIEVEKKAYVKLGIPHTIDFDPPVPIKTSGAIGMNDQAQFNPMRFLYKLSGGLQILENTPVLAIEGKTAITHRGRIRAKNIVLATHFPILRMEGAFFIKMYQHRSYVIALKNAPTINGMYVDGDPYGYSFRNYRDMLFIGGGDHRTGCKGGNWAELIRMAGIAYPEAEQEYAWSTQDCITLDGMPYIGEIANWPGLFVATGFNKWGMCGSMVSAFLLSDRICGTPHEYENIFVVKRRLIINKLLLNGLHAAAGMASFGKRCPHMGCALKWNKVERTWDCPCHGSRFEENGQLINTPANRDKEIKAKQ